MENVLLIFDDEDFLCPRLGMVGVASLRVRGQTVKTWRAGLVCRGPIRGRKGLSIGANYVDGAGCSDVR